MIYNYEEYEKWVDLIASLSLEMKMGSITASNYRANMRIAVMGLNDFKFDEEGDVKSPQTDKEDQ